MNKQTHHCSDEHLLLHADGELTPREEARVRSHLSGCPACQAHLARIRATLDHVTQAHRNPLNSTIDAAGPRALLIARLGQLAPAHSAWRHLRFARPVACASALALLIAIGVGVALLRSSQPAATYANLSAGPLPDPSFTPGSTRSVSLSDLCSSQRDEVVRRVPGSLQETVFQEYGIQDQPTTNFEVDYLITPGLGGTDDVRNLWPEPHTNTTWNSYVKDQLEDHLHQLVCQRKLDLRDAQRDIAGNWISAYKKYFHTELPIANPTQVGLFESRQLRFTSRRKQRVS